MSIRAPRLYMQALTMAQFFEMRYSKNFRVFAGIVCWSASVPYRDELPLPFLDLTLSFHCL